VLNKHAQLRFYIYSNVDVRFKTHKNLLNVDIVWYPLKDFITFYVHIPIKPISSNKKNRKYYICLISCHKNDNIRQCTIKPSSLIFQISNKWILFMNTRILRKIYLLHSSRKTIEKWQSECRNFSTNFFHIFAASAPNIKRWNIELMFFARVYIVCGTSHQCVSILQKT
jgi:hypothetical protein